MTKTAKISIDFAKLKTSEKYRSEVCVSLYKSEELGLAIRSFVVKNNGSEEDFKEVFHDSIVAFFDMAVVKNQVIEDPQAYIYRSAINRYKNKAINEAKWVSIELNLIEEVEEGFHNHKDLMRICEKVYALATDTCRQVLKLWSSNLKMTEIAAAMGYKSEMMARKKKHDCLSKLIEYFSKNPSQVEIVLEYE